MKHHGVPRRPDQPRKCSRCGGKSVLTMTLQPGIYWVRCRICEHKTDRRSTPEDAIALWNREGGEP